MNSGRVLDLHGFASGPLSSQKAQYFRRRLAECGIETTDRTWRRAILKISPFPDNWVSLKVPLPVRP